MWLLFQYIKIQKSQIKFNKHTHIIKKAWEKKVLWKIWTNRNYFSFIIFWRFQERMLLLSRTQPMKSQHRIMTIARQLALNKRLLCGSQFFRLDINIKTSIWTFACFCVSLLLVLHRKSASAYLKVFILWRENRNQKTKRIAQSLQNIHILKRYTYIYCKANL